MRSKVLAVAIAASLFAAPAYASFVYSDTVAPARATIVVPTINEFFPSLAALGASTMSHGASLALSAPGTIVADYFGKEAVFANSFQWRGATVATASVARIDPWEPRSIGRFPGVAPGVLEFAFCTGGGTVAGPPVPGHCLTNAQNDATAAPARTTTTTTWSCACGSSPRRCPSRRRSACSASASSAPDSRGGGAPDRTAPAARARRVPGARPGTRPGQVVPPSF